MQKTQYKSIIYILLILNIFLYTINISSLVGYIDISNFYPLLKTNTNNIIPTAIKIASINYLPLITILVIPKDKLTTPKKYNKSLISGYIIGAIISFGLVVTTFGVLGIDLVNTFEYSEYIVLRKVRILGFLERIENIISLQWIIGSYIYLTVLIYTMTKSISIKSKKINTWITSIIGISLVAITLLIFKDNTIFDNYVRNIFSYIISGIILIYILLIIKIFISKTNLQKT